MAPARERLIVITGPTASGKTDLASAVAKELGKAPPFRRARVISADSRQVYAGMNIGTVTPLRPASGRGFAGQEPHGHLEPDIIQGVAHYLLNIRRPDEPLSLADWQAAAFQVIDQIHTEGSPAILTGGAMLYIDSIAKNYDVPQIPPHKEFRAAKEKENVAALYAELSGKDPTAIDFIQPTNKRRIIRALEVMAATNRRFSDVRRQRPARYDVTMIGLFDSWKALQQRIESRVQKMFSDGLLRETQHMLDAYGPDLPLLHTMNYQQALSVIGGQLSVDEAKQVMVRANLHYARRQMKWWRGRQEVKWFDGRVSDKITAYLSEQGFNLVIRAKRNQNR